MENKENDGYIRRRGEGVKEMLEEKQQTQRAQNP
jgi:hypothetical protein